MRTAIFTGNTSNNLIIQTSEPANLVQLGASLQLQLTTGTNTVALGPGVFKVVTSNGISVSSSDQQPSFDVQSTSDDKNGDWPDPQKSSVTLGASTASVHQFFATGARRL